MKQFVLDQLWQSLSNSYSFSILLLSIYLAVLKCNLLCICNLLLHYICLIVILRVGLRRRVILANFFIIFVNDYNIPFELIFLSLICMRRFLFAGMLVIPSGNPSLLMTIPTFSLILTNQVKFINYCIGLLLGLLIRGYLTRNISWPKYTLGWRDVAGGLCMYYPMYKRWKPMLRDRYIFYTERQLILALDSLLLPSIFNPQPRQRILLLFGCLMIRAKVWVNLWSMVAALVIPGYGWRNALFTSLLIRCWKGWTGEEERMLIREEEFIRKMRMYQNEHLQFSYELPKHLTPDDLKRNNNPTTIS